MPRPRQGIQVHGVPEEPLIGVDPWREHALQHAREGRLAEVWTVLAKGEVLQLNSRKTRARPEGKNSPGPRLEAGGWRLKAFLRSMCTAKRGCPGGIFAIARAKSSEESSLKVGGADPSRLFCLTQLRIAFQRS